MDRRLFMGATAASGLIVPAVHSAAPARQFHLWAVGCSHVGTDLRVGKRESLAEAIRQSENGTAGGGPPWAAARLGPCAPPGGRL